MIGSRYSLGVDEQDGFRTGVAAADVSDLRRPEDRFERPFGKLQRPGRDVLDCPLGARTSDVISALLRLLDVAG